MDLKDLIPNILVVILMMKIKVSTNG